MNTKNNARRRETRRKIEETFIELLKKKEMTGIHVADICEKVQVNRSTFYANYADVFDLANQIKQRLVHEVNRMLGEEGDLAYGEEKLLRLFYHIRNNRDLYFLYFKLGYDAQDELKLYDVYTISSISNLEYHLVFFKNGLNAMICRWLEGGCQESPEQMRDILLWEYRGRYGQGVCKE